MATTRARLRALLWTGAYLASTTALWGLGDREWLQVGWGDPLDWLSVVGVETALAALGRVAGLALLGWIGVTSAAYVLARLMGADRDSVHWLSIGPVRRAVDALLAGSIMLGTVSPAGATLEVPAQSPPVSSAPAGAVDPRYVPIPAGSTPETPAGAERPQEGTPEEPEEHGPGMVEVAPGDHLWKLASDRLEEALQRPPTRAEVAAYWSRVVEVNRDRIRSGDPDLIFPGEEIVLPPLPD